MKPLRLGLIGYGINRHQHPLNGSRGEFLFSIATDGIENVVPAAICDTSPEALERAAAKYPKSALFSDYNALLDSGCVDAVIIATPVQFHAPVALAAMAAGVHVLSEIPVIWSLQEAHDLWAAQQNSTALYMTGANPNFLGYIDAMVDLKESGLLGEPIYAEAEYLHDIQSLCQYTPWRADMEPIRYCTHSLGPLLRIIPEDLKSVTCFTTGSHLNKTEGENDFMVALFRTRSGVVVRLLVSFINKVGAHHHYRVYTTKGGFERTRPAFTTADSLPHQGPRTLFYHQNSALGRNPIELPVGDLPPRYIGNPHAKGHNGIDYAMLDAFIGAIRSGGASPVSLRDGLRMSLPGLFAAASAANGGQLTEITYPWE